MAMKELERLRDVVMGFRGLGETERREARGRVYVTPSGRVVIGDQVEDGEEHMLSEVHPAVFAAPRD